MLPFINIPFEYVGGILGTPPDQLKLVFSFYLSYPLAGILKRIPDREPWKKNAFIVLVSLFYLVGLFDLWDGLITLFISAAAAYIIAWKIESPYMPWVGFVFLMGHMSISHIYRQILNDDSVVDITGAQMVMIMKLTAFCWNVQDGKLPSSELSAFQNEHAIRELPSVLDYAGYVLFFPSLFAGPAFDYCDYTRYISTTMFALPPGVDPSKAPPTRKKRKIPRSGTPAAKKAIVGTFFIVAFLQLSGIYNVSFFISPNWAGYGIFRRVWHLYMLGLTTRLKYYGVWNLTEGSCILSGIGYNGIDTTTGRARWDRLTNIHPVPLELAQNSHAFVGNWNINTNHWLRNYVYLRVTPKGRKPGFRATLATFVTSAFWHGFYPGYYMSFVLASFIQTVAKNCRRIIRPLFLTPDGKKELPSKKYYDAATFFITQITFAYATAPFVILSFRNSWLVWSRVYFYVLWGTAAGFAIFDRRLPVRSWLVGMQKKRTAGLAPASEKAGTTADAKGAVDDIFTAKPSHAQPGIAQSRPAAISKETELEIDRIAREEAEAHLAQQSQEREQAQLLKGAPVLGLPDDPMADIDEIVAEVRKEIAERKRRGSLSGGVKGADIRRAVDEKVRELKAGLRRR